MKVLLVLDSYPPDLNGGAYFTHRLAKALIANGIEVKVACPSLNFKTHSDTYEAVPLCRFSSFPSILYKNFRIVNPIGLRKHASVFLKQFKPDVIHLQGKFILGNVIFKEAKKLQIPCLATNHLMPENFEHYFKTPKPLKRIYRKIVWKWVFDMYRQLPLVVSPTLSGANEMRRNGYEKPIHIQSCGIDISLFSNPRNKADIRTDFGLPDLPIVLYTGRLDKEKNIDIVLKACAIALRKIKFHLVITGTGKEENKLKKMGRKLGIQNQIKFTGKLDDSILPEIYSASDIFVNACNVELQCISALEAIAAGLPVLLSDSLALPELINKEKPNGFCFRPNDSIQLAEKLVFLLSNAELRKEMGNNSLKLAIKHDIANTASGYIEYYKKVIK